MELIKVKTGEYYDRPEFYPYMARSVFDALEAAVLKGSVNGEDIVAEVPKDEFEKMIEDYENEKGRRNEKN